jgi:hypothetical protein
MARALQDLVIEWAGRAIPVGPGHNDPLEPDSNDEASSWVSPTSRSMLLQRSELGAAMLLGSLLSGGADRGKGVLQDVEPFEQQIVGDHQRW